MLKSLNVASTSKNAKPPLIDLSSLSKNEEYKKPIWLKGNISKDIPITMVLYPKGEVYEGYYLYDRAFKKWRTRLSIDASIKGNMMHINVFDQTKKVIEKFELTIKAMDKAYYVEGDWIAQDRKLPVRLADIELHDDHVTCEEIQLAPDYVFNRDIDFGVGHSSQTMEVDGHCKLGMPNLELSKNAYALAEAIRLDPPWGMGCAGSIVYVHARVESYRFMMAAYAPDVFYKKFHENDTRNKKSLDNWSKKSFYSNRVAAEFGREIEKLKPILNNYYKNNVEDNDAKANLYSDVSVNALISYAAGSGENEDPKPSLISVYEQSGINVIKEQEELDVISYQDALNFALLNNYAEDLVDTLIDRVKNVNYGNESPIFYGLNNRENVLKLLKNGADINYQNSFGKTVVFYAIQNPDFTLLKFLVSNGANINHKYKTKADYKKLGEMTMDEFCIQKKGRTPLMHAAQHSTVDIVLYLINSGADVDMKDDNGDKAIDYAKAANNLAVYEYLKSIDKS